MPFVSSLLERVNATFRHAGPDPLIGAHLGLVLREAGLAEVETFGVQAYLAPDDPRGPALLAGVVRSLAPSMEAAGIATSDVLELETLQERAGYALQEARAVLLSLALVGAWGRVS